MFVMNNFLQENADQINTLEEKLSSYLPLEQFLKNDDAILCVKACGEKTREYLNSAKIKKLIKLITEEPDDDNQIRGHKIPYVASEILKLDCPYILERFILSEKEYNEKYNQNNNKPVETKVDGTNEKTENENSSKSEELNNNIKTQNDSQKENNKGKENNEKNGEEYKFIDSDEDKKIIKEFAKQSYEKLLRGDFALHDELKTGWGDWQMGKEVVAYREEHPEVPYTLPPEYKAKKITDDCIKCKICVKNCPTDAIDIENKLFDLDKCISCYSCVNRCPKGAIKAVPAQDMVQIITSFVADSQRRQEPSLFF